MARTEKIKLVQNDTKPVVQVTLTDTVTGLPIDLSNPSDTVKLYFKALGQDELKTTITGNKPNGGSDGVISFPWATGDLDTAGEFEGEIEITYADGKIQTMYDKLRFSVRADIGP